MKKHLKMNNKGFTLVELMVALVVFAIGILAVGQLQVTSIRYNAHAQRMSEATMLAQGQMDSMLACAYVDASVGTVSYDTSNPTYTITTKVTEDSEDLSVPIAAIKQINVEVTWTSRGTTKNVTLDSIRTDLD